MVTPGTADAASDARGDRGRSLYRFRLNGFVTSKIDVTEQQ